MKNALLFTKNATIKKLFSLSLEKKGITLKEGDVENQNFSDIDIVFVDSEISNDIPQIPQEVKKVLIVGKNEEKKVGFDEYMIKPFLPTDLIELINKIENPPQNNKTDEPDLGLDDLDLDEKELNNNMELDNLDSDLGLDDLGSELEDFKDLDIDNSLDDISNNLNIDDVDNSLDDISNNLNIDNVDNSLDDISNDLNIDNVDNSLDDISNDLNIDNVDNSLDDSNNNLNIDNVDNSLDDANNNLNIDNVDNSIEEYENSLNNEEDSKTELDEELNQIDEVSIAQAIGEEIELPKENTQQKIVSDTTIPKSEEKLEENQENIPKDEPNNTQDDNQKTDNNQNMEHIQKETLSSLLNLDLDALKKSGATLTITIKFEKD
jgi:uncharacterized membrane protein